ncbi:WD40 repeat domain-containing serine/threonine protein kinase [Candidatus Uabimicrobium sp. HlEnr_7]|uniref:WD40 repeat domain-containing serine/threonine protein kinase n=1 Tax=Candidatus Uabimicrobium helgolandensis TaxID=3095367 RepID=UPI0035560223
MSSIKTVNAFTQYKIISELGRGGMGVVYKAFDQNLQRFVALKVIHESNIKNDAVKRFLREIKTVAALQHPNIVQLYESGTSPQIYFTMEYIDGLPLRDKIKTLQFQFEELALIFIKICYALQQMHHRKIIHRDIKPDNIMLTAENEPKLMDFGLAKHMMDFNSLSQQGDIIGTPFYMSPEQALSANTDARTDIYSLGATLYEMLTARPPFLGKLYVQVAYNVVNNDPIAPRLLNNEIPSDLELICLKCLEKSPFRRYPNIESLLSDLENYLQHKPISIKSERLYRFKKWCYRHKILSLSAIFFVFLLATISFFSYEKWHTSKQLQKLNSQLILQQKAKEDALVKSQQQLMNAHVKMAQYQYYQRNMKNAYNELQKAKAIQKSSILPLDKYVEYFTKYSIKPLIMSKEKSHTFPKIKNVFANYKYTKDYICMTHSGGVYVWKKKDYINLSANNIIFKIQHQLCTLKDHNFVYYNGKEVSITDLRTKKTKRFSFASKAHFSSIAYFGEWIAMQRKEQLILFNLNNKKKQLFNSERSISIQVPPQFFNNGKYLAAGIESSIGVWRLVNNKKWQLHASFSFLGKHVAAYEVSPAGNQVVYGDRSGNIHMIDMQEKITSVFRKHSAMITDIVFNEDGRLFASADNNGYFVIWDALSQKPIKAHKISTPIEHLHFGKNQYLAVVSRKNDQATSEYWNVERGIKSLQLRDRKTTIQSVLKTVGVDSGALFYNPVLISPNSKYVAFVYRSAISMWNIEQSSHHIFLVDENWLHSEICRYRFSSDSKRLAILYSNGRLIILSTKDMEVLVDKKTTGRKNRFYQDGFLTFAANGDLFFLVKLQDRDFRILKYSNTQKKVLQISPFEGKANYAEFNTQGDLAVGDMRGRIHIFSQGNLSKKPRVTIDTKINNAIRYISWSDNRKIFVCVEDEQYAFVFLLMRDSYVLEKKIPVATKIRFAQFSNDNKDLAIFETNRLYIYNLKNLFRVELLPGYYKGGLASMSKDWKWLALPSTKGQVILAPLTFR